MDWLQLSANAGADVVRGVQAPLEAGNESTYNHGDVIDGNGKTIIDLVMAGGVGRAVQASNIAEVQVNLLMDGTFQAAGYTNLGLLKVDSGITGNSLDANNVELGTGLEVSGVAAEIVADYQPISSHVGAVGLTIGTDSQQAIAGSVDASNNVEVAGGEESWAYVSVDAAKAELGNVSIVLGNSADAHVSVSASDVSVGDISLVVGDTSHASIDLSANVGVAGDLSIVGGNNGFADVRLSDVAAAGIEVTMGDSANVEVGVLGSSDVVVGNIDVNVGATGDVRVDLGDEGAGSVSAGDITVNAGAASSVTIDVGTSGAIQGDVSVGNITANMEGGYALVNVDGTTDVTLGDISVTGASTADVSVTAAYGTDSADLTVGSITVALNADSTGNANVSLSQGALSLDNAGNMTVGDITISANVNASSDDAINLSAWQGGYSHGDMTIGDITLTAGSETSAYTEDTESNDASSVDISVSISSSQNSPGTLTAGGNLVVGDIMATVGNGYVSGTLTNDASIDIEIGALAGNELGNVTVGNATLTGGDFADLRLDINQTGRDDGTVLGDLTVGDVTFNAGESAYVKLSVTQSAETGSQLGNMTVGDITVNVAQDAEIYLDLHQSITSDSDVNVVGDMSVGDITMVGGDNGIVDISIEQDASGDSGTANSFGDLTVGNISVALSATGPAEDNSGGSSIEVGVYKTHWYDGSSDAGNMTVGNVDLSLVDSGTIDLEITYEGSFQTQGNLTVGDITIAAGDDAGVSVDVSFSNDTTGNMGDLTVGDINLSVGDNARYAYVDITVDKNGYDGDMGNLTIGDSNLVVGKASDMSFDIEVDFSGANGNMGNITVGDVNLTVGEAGAIDWAFSLTGNSGDTAGNDIGNVTFGDVTANIGKDANAYVDVTITDVGANTNTNGNIGNITLGFVTANVGEGAHFSYDASFTADETVGSVTAGAISLTVGEGANAQYALNMSGGYDAAGDMTVGDISVTLLDGAHAASVNIGVSEWNNDSNLTVGNITLDIQGTGTENEAHLDLTADGDINIGNVTISGQGYFALDGNSHAGENVSYLQVSEGGDVSIGNVDFSGYEGVGLFMLDSTESATVVSGALIDLRFTDAGAASVIGSDYDDVIYDNVGNNVIAGGAGLDTIYITAGGSDTLSFVDGDSGSTVLTADLIDSFNVANDLLDFNLVGGTGANTVIEGWDGDFVASANDALNSTVKYYIQQTGSEAYVAVNYGSGDADLVIHLIGVSGTLTAADLIA